MRPTATTFVAAAATSTLILPALAYCGYVPIGTTDHVPEGVASDTQALLGETVAQTELPFAIEDFVTGEMLLAGTIEQRVVMEAEKQSLTFHYLVTNTPTPEGDGALARLSAFNFGELVHTDVDYIVDDAAIGKPSRIGRSANVVDAYFDGGDRTLLEGDSISFFVRTNATQFDTSGFVIADATSPVAHPTSGQVRSAVVGGMYRAVVEGPVAVPLPGALYSGVIGLAGVAWARRRMAAR